MTRDTDKYGNDQVQRRDIRRMAIIFFMAVIVGVVVGVSTVGLTGAQEREDLTTTYAATSGDVHLVVLSEFGGDLESMSAATMVTIFASSPEAITEYVGGVYVGHEVFTVDTCPDRPNVCEAEAVHIVLSNPDMGIMSLILFRSDEQLYIMMEAGGDTDTAVARWTPIMEEVATEGMYIDTPTGFIVYETNVPGL